MEVVLEKEINLKDESSFFAGQERGQSEALTTMRSLRRFAPQDDMNFEGNGKGTQKPLNGNGLIASSPYSPIALKTKTAFTLAEVLITLGIIGIVAALTLPALIQKNTEKQTVVAVKKAYSEFSQAYSMVIQEYGSMGALVDKNKSLKFNAQTAYNEVTKYMKKVKSCNNGEKCMAEKYYSLNGVLNTDVGNDNNYNIQSGILADGTNFWILSSFRSNGVYNGQILVDVNGHKKPNRLGVDAFLFIVLENGRIVPNGVELSELNDWYSRGNYKECNMTSTNKYNGYGCTALLLKNENMDYLK